MTAELRFFVCLRIIVADHEKSMSQNTVIWREDAGASQPTVTIPSLVHLFSVFKPSSASIVCEQSFDGSSSFPHRAIRTVHVHFP